MTWTQITSVEGGQLILTLPASFESKKVKVVVEDLPEKWAAKWQLMQQAAKDPLFLADMEEINQDFDAIDGENL
jgi:hypothetical protein